MKTLQLSLLTDELAVCRMAPDAAIPEWATRAAFFCVMRTTDELSIVTLAAAVPEGVPRAHGWRALKLHGPFDFSETGLLASVLSPLGDAGVSIFALSTYDTDYVLVRTEQVDPAIDAVRAAGHSITR